jgi:glycosyltransferase involved in cell wall biosynthesis
VLACPDLVRVVFFLQGRYVPAARARGFALASWLERAGVSCLCLAPRPSVYGDTALPWPLAAPRPLYSVAAALPRLLQLRQLRDHDVVFFQRFMVQLPTVALERRVARRHPTLFDFDDAIYATAVGRRKLDRITALVDRVVAGNDTLAEAAAAPEKTTVIPTAIDTERFTPATSRRSQGPVVVGWTGLASNYRQLAIALPGIQRALVRTGARFRIISNAPPPRALAALNAEYVPWRPATEIDDLRALDVGVMPLPDDAYARGKCAFKLLQYMALGLPGVASPVGVNRQVVRPGVDGFLPATDDEWTEALVRLVEDARLRQELGEAARERVVTAYSRHALFPRYLGLLERLAR